MQLSELRAQVVRQSGLPGEFDPASNLPSLPAVIPQIQAMLQAHGSAGIILLDLEPLNPVEAECGSAAFNRLTSLICAELGKLRNLTIRNEDILCALRPYGEQLAIFLQPPRSLEELNESSLESVAERVGSALLPRVAELTRPYNCEPRIRLGYSLVMLNSMVQLERLIYRGLDQAKLLAADFSRRMNARDRQRIRDLIVNRQLTHFVQPIVHMDNGQVLAYEALIRGPAGTEFASPITLFKLATHTELLFELDRACCEAALGRLPELPEGTILFANVLPPLINDPLFRRRLLQMVDAGFDPRKLVLELTEGMAVRSYELLSRSIAELREAGIRIALDDLGTGYTNLDHVIRLRPDFLKLDLSLIRGIHQDTPKQTLVRSLVSVGQAVGATLIAEGIEEEAERDTLVELGIKWGQGFFYARPRPAFLP